jgi:NAD(P)H-hydrate epimerase
MPEPLYTAAEMRAAEERYPGYPDTAGELMDRAGRAVADEALRRFPDARRFFALCGKGANGGDGRIAARILAEAGLEETDESPDFALDALFGTGFHGALRAEAAAQIEQLNALGVPVVAVDLPSGVDASTGEIAGAAVEAAVTVTFHGRKVGLEVGPGRFNAGDVVVADIGLEPLETEHRVVQPEILRLVPHRRQRDNKYSAGSVLVVGGSRGLTGAPSLAAEAAFRADAGYVTVAAPASALPVLEQRLVEAVKRPCPEDADGRLTLAAADEILDLAGRARAVALGPGLGRSPETKQLVRRLLGELELPVVVDADALFELEPVERAAPTVLTPHSGELARLLGEESSWVDAHRLEAVRRGSERFGAVCLLKGADTLVCEPGSGVHVTALGTPGLATAGTGDVLTGIVAAFLSKGMEPRLAAAAGAAAGQLAARLVEPVGMVASDVIRALPRALAQHA